MPNPNQPPQSPTKDPVTEPVTIFRNSRGDLVLATQSQSNKVATRYIEAVKGMPWPDLQAQGFTMHQGILGQAPDTTQPPF